MVSEWIYEVKVCFLLIILIVILSFSTVFCILYISILEVNYVLSMKMEILTMSRSFNAMFTILFISTADSTS